MPITYWAIVCPHKHPKTGLRVIHAFVIVVEATPKYVQERARECLAGMLIDPDDAATMRVVQTGGGTYAIIKAEPDRACEMRKGFLRVIRRAQKTRKLGTKEKLLSWLQLWAHDTLTSEQQAVIQTFIKRMRTL